MFNVIIMDKKLEYLKILDANYSLINDLRNQDS